MASVMMTSLLMASLLMTSLLVTQWSSSHAASCKPESKTAVQWFQFQRRRSRTPPNADLLADSTSMDCGATGYLDSLRTVEGRESRGGESPVLVLPKFSKHDLSTCSALARAPAAGTARSSYQGHADVAFLGGPRWQLNAEEEEEQEAARGALALSSAARSVAHGHQ